MAGNHLSIVVSDSSNSDDNESPPLAITQQWEIHYSHFFRSPPNNLISNSNSSSTKLKPLPRFRNGGTWFAAASTATLQITPNLFNPQSNILVVFLQGRIIEEHYTSNLQFSLLQLSCVNECPDNGSRVVIASYRDTYGQIQKFALRFKTSSHAGIFINSLKRVGVSKSTKQPKDFAHGEQPNLAVTKEAMSVSKKRKRKDLKGSLEKVSLKDAMDTSVPSSGFTSEISSESEFVSSNRLQCRGDELSFVEPVATSSPLVTSVFNYKAKQNECSQEPLLGYNSKSISEVDMPPSFTALLSNCSGEVKQEQVYIPVKEPEEDNDLKSQIKRYMADPSFHDILAKVDKVFTEMGGFLEL